MAEALIAGMTSKWDPEKYHDEYREALEKVIQEKIEHPQAQAKAPSHAKKATKVIDLVSVLQQSLAQHGKGPAKKAKKAPARKAPAKKGHHLKKAA
jgi:DNA end-binding protein Ku